MPPGMILLYMVRCCVFIYLGFHFHVNLSPSVNGRRVALSLVTEEDQEEMTPDEYTAYYELLSAQS